MILQIVSYSEDVVQWGQMGKKVLWPFGWKILVYIFIGCHASHKKIHEYIFKILIGRQICIGWSYVVEYVRQFNNGYFAYYKHREDLKWRCQVGKFNWARNNVNIHCPWQIFVPWKIKIYNEFSHLYVSLE